jgi:hypothetical protein
MCYSGQKMRIMIVSFVSLFRKGQMGKFSPSSFTKLLHHFYLSFLFVISCRTDTAGLQAVGPYNQEIYFASIDMTDVIQQLDLRIVECRFVNGQWELVRIRIDSEFVK